MPGATIEHLIVNWRRRRRESVLEPSADELLLLAEIENDATAVRGHDQARRFGRAPPFTFPSVPVTQAHYRRAADTYVEAPDGTVQIWNGIDKPQRFDPSLGSLENVGVIAPTSAIDLNGNGVGPIVGTFFAYTRFVDRSGNLSSLSPISNVFTPKTFVGTITNVTNASPMVVTIASTASLGTGQIVKISGVYGNAAANGIWKIIVLSATTFSLYAGGGVASIASGTYNSGGTVTSGVSSLIYANVPTPTEAKVTRRQILRNKDGDTSVFYIDIDTTDLTSSSFTSQTDDADLVTEVPLTDDNAQTLVDKSLPLTSKKLIAQCLGRMFASGNEPYSEGAVVLTSGSAAVTGIGTEWGPITLKGRFFEVAGGSKRYTIDSVASTTSLTLTEAYAGSTDPYAYYTISSGPAERRTLYWTPPSQPEAWPRTNSLALAEDPNAGEITALVPLRSWLYPVTENRLYRFSYVDDPLFDGEVVPAGNRGLVNNRVWVKVDFMMYGMDTLGFYQFAGNDLNDISTPAVQDLFRNRQAGPYRINWTAKRNFHAVYDPGEGTIRWFVCLGSAYAPYHAVCYQIRLRRWWLEEYPFPIGAACIGRLNGKPQVYLGTDAKRIMALHQSTLDAVDAGNGTVRGTVTSSGVDWIVDSAASFQSGLAGQEVQLIGGRGKGQRRRIASQATTRLTMTQPWTTAPDTTTSYQIGGVTWRWRSAWLSFIDGPGEMQREISIQFSTTNAASQMHLRIYEDTFAAAQAWVTSGSLADGNGINHLADDPTGDLAIDTTKVSGYVKQRFTGMREYQTDAPRFVAVDLGGVTNADPVRVLQVSLGEVAR